MKQKLRKWILCSSVWSSRKGKEQVEERVLEENAFGLNPYKAYRTGTARNAGSLFLAAQLFLGIAPETLGGAVTRARGEREREPSSGRRPSLASRLRDRFNLNRRGDYELGEKRLGVD